MIEKRPLCIYNGEVKELSFGDVVPSEFSYDEVSTPLKIPQGRQMLVFDVIDISSDLTIDGKLVIL